MPHAAPSQSSRTSTPASSGNRKTPTASTSSGKPSEIRGDAILTALEKAGNPLAVFRNAAILLGPEEKIKTEHYISTIYSLIMKRTSELVVSTDVPPLVTLGLQFYSLECLLQNTSYFAIHGESEGMNATEDKAVMTLASTLHRAIVSFGKLSTANGMSDADIAEQLSKKVLPLLDQIKDVVKPEERMSQCKTFLETTNLLVQLLARGDVDTCALNTHIPQVADAPTVSDGNGNPGIAIQDRATAERQGIRSCSALAVQVTTLEKWIASQYLSEDFDSASLQASLTTAFETLRLLSSEGAEKDTASAEKIRHNLIRSLERLHHYAYRAYKSLHKDLPQRENNALNILVLRELLSAFCGLAETSDASPEVLARTIDTLLLFAHVDFLVDAPPSYRNAYKHLERCQILIEKKPVRSQDNRLYGTVASSAYAIGRSLYNAEKYANAIPFLEISCRATDTLLVTFDDTQPQDSQVTLLDKSASRWELIGSAYAQCEEKEDAADAYAKCIQSLYRQSIGSDPVLLLHDPPFLRVLAKYTKLTVLDMSRPPESASVAVMLDSSQSQRLDYMAKGFVLEAQSSCLLDLVHKSEALVASLQWLSEAALAFEACDSDANLAR